MRDFSWVTTALLPLTVMAAGAVGTAQAQTSLQAKLTVRPLTQGDVAAYKLPAGTQLSGGLYTVGVGQPLYLETQVNIAVPVADLTGVTWALVYKPSESKAALQDSPLGPNVPLYEPSDRVVAQLAGRKLLVPDVTGAYVVAATITTASNGTANVAQTFIAATYMGIETCTICHGGLLPQNQVATWSQTGHAQMFKQGLDGVAGDHYGSGCVSCHTVGYDKKAVNGGFDDVAASLAWTFPTAVKPGTWDALPHELKNLGNIQCENCHGPGSVHVSGSFDIGLSVSMGSGVCGQCHDAPTHHIKTAEWNNSVHAVATQHASGPGNAGCVGCHTGAGFIGRMKGAKTLDTTYAAVNCQSCHESHGDTAPAANAHLVRTMNAVTLADGTKVTDAGAGLLCMNCHQSRRNAAKYAATEPGSARFGPHHGPQGDMLEGVNGFTYGQTIASSKHASVEDTCVTCHMQTVAETDAAFTHAGGHTFKPSWAGDSSHPVQDLVGACQKCHGQGMTAFNTPLMDYDGDGTIQGVQTEVQNLLDKLSSMLPPAGQPKSSLTIDSTWTRAQLEAAYNWQFVSDDGSRGIHNTAYAVGLLKASIADLSANK